MALGTMRYMISKVMESVMTPPVCRAGAEVAPGGKTPSALSRILLGPHRYILNMMCTVSRLRGTNPRHDICGTSGWGCITCPASSAVAIAAA